MLRRDFLNLLLVSAACSPAQSTRSSAASQQQSVTHLTIDGTVFRSGRARFDWRGITAFRLLEMVAHGREQEATAYLDWASRSGLTVLRVFVMADGLFQLSIEDGLAALPRLLDLAAARQLYVEIVALTGTAVVKIDLESAVRRAAAIADRYSNALVEIANEPWHPTQDERLHDPKFVAKLGALVPARIPLALGSAEADGGYAAGRYVTWHSPRSNSQDGWGHVLALAQGPALLQRWQKPLVSDEPIGAADVVIPGRRDNEPRRFAAAAALTRLSGLGATFHYEGGLQAAIPAGRSNECFLAWRAGLDLLNDLPEEGTFLNQDALSKRATVGNSRAAFGRSYENEIWIVAVDPGDSASVVWREGWRLQRTQRAAGVAIFRGRR